jgi:L-threonylcarbamoyladenylate synthase
MSDGGLLLDTPAILERLAGGAVVLMATDTVPGLHARLDRPVALNTLMTLKGRAPDKPLLVLAASMDQALMLATDIASPARRFLKSCWPGPFTIILPAVGGLPALVTRRVETDSPARSNGAAERRNADTSGATVAVRIPDWETLRLVLQASGPLASSSANRTAGPAAADLGEARRLFPGLPVWYGEPERPAGVASALVDLTGPRPRLLRPGPLPLPPWHESPPKRLL